MFAVATPTYANSSPRYILYTTFCLSSYCFSSSVAILVVLVYECSYLLVQTGLHVLYVIIGLHQVGVLRRRPFNYDFVFCVLAQKFFKASLARYDERLLLKKLVAVFVYELKDVLTVRTLNFFAKNYLLHNHALAAIQIGLDRIGVRDDHASLILVCTPDKVAEDVAPVVFTVDLVLTRAPF